MTTSKSEMTTSICEMYSFKKGNKRPQYGKSISHFEAVEGFLA